MSQVMTKPTDTSDREIVMSRVFDAPRELVFQVWTDPTHVTQWWGPRGFSTTTQSMDVRPGGDWRYCMHGPDGRDYENRITYLEVVRPQRLVYRHGGAEDADPANFQVTVTFEDQGGKTKLTMRSVFASAEAREFVVKTYGAIEGAKQTLDRLGEHLAAMTGSSTAAAGREFVIQRLLSAPREIVFRAWTEREQLMQWFGPKGVKIVKATLDLRPGGTFHYCMRWPDGSDMWGRWVFREIVPPQRLVFVSSFSNESGAIAKAPFFEHWPLETLSAVTFDEHAGIGRGTLVTVRWSAMNATEPEAATFEANFDSMRGGWTGTFEQLEAYLAKG
jgi:uncharacterized protein YndB with AHSA1/START domain